MARAEAVLELAGAEVVSLADAADAPLFEPAPDEMPLWPTVAVRALFDGAADLEPLCAILRATCAPFGAIEIAVLPDSSWLDAARQQFTARRIGARLWLAPWDSEPGPAELTTVRLHMGLAFGTGEHPTTALCLEWLERRATSGTTLLDYGCGSGILALAAVALGARFAYAVDNDPQALTAARANAALNGAADRVFVGAPEQLPAVSVDVLVANILAGPLVELAPTFAKLVAPGGMLVLSGILEAQAAGVAAAYAPYLANIERAARDGWVRLAGSRNAS